MSAIAAVDTALWDLKAKAAGLPVIYGDASSLVVLEAAGVHSARLALVVVLAGVMQFVIGLAGGGKNKFDLRGRDVLREDAAHTTAFVVDFQHDLRGRVDVMVKVLLKHEHHELHGREIVVEHDDLVQARGLQCQ